MTQSDPSPKASHLPPFIVQLIAAAFTANDLWRRLLPTLTAQTGEDTYLRTVALREQERLNRFIDENPMLFIGPPEEKEPVQAVACQIQRGVIPALTDLAKAFPANPDTPQSRQLLNRFNYFLSQAGELGEMRGEQLRLALGLRSRKNILRQLQTANQRPEEPGNGHYEYLSQHTQYLSRLIQETENALIPLLAEDPCVGDSIHLNAQKQAYPRWIQRFLRWLDAFRQFRSQGYLA